MTLRKLIEAVEAGDADFTASDGWIDAWDSVAPDLQTYRHKSDGDSASIIAHRAYHGSLDAAKALHDALLPGWIWTVGPTVAVVWPSRESEGYSAPVADNPARAWLLAILRAMEEGV